MDPPPGPNSVVLLETVVAFLNILLLSSVVWQWLMPYDHNNLMISTILFFKIILTTCWAGDSSRNRPTAVRLTKTLLAFLCSVACSPIPAGLKRMTAHCIQVFSRVSHRQGEAPTVRADPPQAVTKTEMDTRVALLALLIAAQYQRTSGRVTTPPSLQSPQRASDTHPTSSVAEVAAQDSPKDASSPTRRALMGLYCALVLRQMAQNESLGPPSVTKLPGATAMTPPDDRSASCSYKATSGVVQTSPQSSPDEQLSHALELRRIMRQRELFKLRMRQLALKVDGFKSDHVRTLHTLERAKYVIEQLEKERRDLGVALASTVTASWTIQTTPAILGFGCMSNGTVDFQSGAVSGSRSMSTGCVFDKDDIASPAHSSRCDEGTDAGMHESRVSTSMEPLLLPSTNATAAAASTQTPAKNRIITSRTESPKLSSSATTSPHSRTKAFVNKLVHPFRGFGVRGNGHEQMEAEISRIYSQSQAQNALVHLRTRASVDWDSMRSSARSTFTADMKEAPGDSQNGNDDTSSLKRVNLGETNDATISISVSVRPITATPKSAAESIIEDYRKSALQKDTPLASQAAVKDVLPLLAAPQGRASGDSDSPVIRQTKDTQERTEHERPSWGNGCDDPWQGANVVRKTSMVSIYTQDTKASGDPSGKFGSCRSRQMSAPVQSNSDASGNWRQRAPSGADAMSVRTGTNGVTGAFVNGAGAGAGYTRPGFGATHEDERSRNAPYFAHGSHRVLRRSQSNISTHTQRSERPGSLAEKVKKDGMKTLFQNGWNQRAQERHRHREATANATTGRS